ncbi:response regulator transcription factor [Allopusillimonas ginsengisoli]|uniref:response regulator transcription factor n=1 Tax=Allopusillimonas ginsengisoli TaxID=453575 RepID=UPI0010C19B21|nr:response regulator transcription factor [Allopusillimonas ginsengisoli]
MTQSRNQDHSPFSVLTARERDVMAYVANGKANKVIAAELGVSRRTVEAHRARIFHKLQVRNAVELSQCVMRYGEVPEIDSGSTKPG